MPCSPRCTGGPIRILPGQGSIIALMVQNGAGMAGNDAVSTPTAEYNAEFDSSTSATAFTQSLSGSYGIAWLAGIPVGAATITAGPPPLASTAGDQTSPTQTVVDGAITFVTMTYL